MEIEQKEKMDLYGKYQVTQEEIDKINKDSSKK